MKFKRNKKSMRRISRHLGGIYPSKPSRPRLVHPEKGLLGPRGLRTRLDRVWIDAGNGNPGRKALLAGL